MDDRKGRATDGKGAKLAWSIRVGIAVESSCAMERPLAAIVLAAGLGTRMRSDRAKVLHEIGGEPMIARVLRAIGALGAAPLIVVVGRYAREVEVAARAACREANLRFAIQRDQRGTGDAARCAIEILPRDFHGDILIGCGDMPMITAATLRT